MMRLKMTSVCAALLACAAVSFAATSPAGTPPAGTPPAGNLPAGNPPAAKPSGAGSSPAAPQFKVWKEPEPGSTLEGNVFPPTAGDEAGLGRYVHETVHFTLYTDLNNPRYIARLQFDLEVYFSQLQKEFWDFIKPEYREAHVVVAGFASQESFDALSAADAAVPRGEKGYSTNSGDRIAFVLQDEYYMDVTILVHELTHVFNRHSAGATPIWLDEGLAQYYARYAGAQAGNTAIISGVSTGPLSLIDSASKDESLVHIAGLISMTDQAFYGDGSELNYAESWALVYYLRRGAGPDGDETLSKYYRLLKDGRRHLDAFTAVYGEDFTSLEAAWLEYLAALYEESVKAPRTPAARTRRPAAKVKTKAGPANAK